MIKVINKMNEKSSFNTNVQRMACTSPNEMASFSVLSAEQMLQYKQTTTKGKPSEGKSPFRCAKRIEPIHKLTLQRTTNELG